MSTRWVWFDFAKPSAEPNHGGFAVLVDIIYKLARNNMLTPGLTRFISPAVLETAYSKLISQKTLQVFGKDLPVTAWLPRRVSCLAC